MIVLKQKGPAGRVSYLGVPDMTFNCGGPPPEHDMIAPLHTEAIIPDDPVIVTGDFLYLAHAPVNMPISLGIRVSFVREGAGSVNVGIYANGQNIWIAPVIFDTETTLVSWTAIKPEYRTIPPGTRLEAKIEGLIDSNPYDLYRGLYIAFLPTAVPSP